jgi:hypothetical protein
MPPSGISFFLPFKIYSGKRNLTKFDSARVAAQFNKLEHLESLTEYGSRTFLNNNCMSKLALPVLRNLHASMVGTFVWGEYLQTRKSRKRSEPWVLRFQPNLFW